MKKEASLSRFLGPLRAKYEVAGGDLQLHAVLVRTEGKRAVSIERVARTL
jgi:calcineurin-like phosphoesterase